VSFLNHVVEFVTVIASSVGSKNGAVLYDVAGISGFDDSEEGGEQAHQQEAYQALGIIGRPLPPDDDGSLEALAMRTEDGLAPFAFRDLRLHQALAGGAAPREGQVMFAGYGGAFLSHSMTAGPTGSKRGNVSTWYVPHAFSGDGPTKAHAIIVDPTSGNSSITLVHGDGVFLTLTEDTGSGPGLVASVGGSTFLRMSAGEFSVNAEKILLRGNVYVGRAAEAGVQLLGGPVSPPCPSLFVSAV